MLYLKNIHNKCEQLEKNYFLTKISFKKKKVLLLSCRTTVQPLARPFF